MTIAAPSKIEPISPIRFLISIPSFKVTFYAYAPLGGSNARHLLSSCIIKQTRGLLRTLRKIPAMKLESTFPHPPFPDAAYPICR